MAGTGLRFLRLAFIRTLGRRCPHEDATMSTHEDQPFMLTMWEVARLLGIGLRTLRRHIAAGSFPKPIRIGGSLRYSRKAILEWIDARSEEGNA